jgi:hypothetical protein
MICIYYDAIGNVTSHSKMFYWVFFYFEISVLYGHLCDKIFYYLTSDNVFSDWLMSLVTFFDKML